MPWFTVSGRRVWAGYHGVVGAVVFDPSDQQAVPRDRVRLYLACQGEVLLLAKQFAHDGIKKTNDEGKLRRAAQGYGVLYASRRPAVGPAVPSNPVRTTRARRVRVPRPRPQLEEEPVEVRVPIPGICVRCGSAIAPERLEAVPGTIRCVRCQAAWETETGGERPAVRDLREEWFPRSER